MNRDIKKYTALYLHHNFENFMVKYRRKKVLEIFSKYLPKRILEIGCGMDSLFNYFSKFEKFVVVEPSETFLIKAQRDAENNSKIECIQGYVEYEVSNLKNKNFDFIVVSGLLHEVESPINLIKSVSKICQKNTIVHFNVPNCQSFHLLWAYKSGLINELGKLTPNAKILQQNTVFDMDKLINMVQKENFEILESGSYFVKPFDHKKMMDCMNYDILDENLLDGLYNLSDFFPKNGAEIFVNCKMK